MDLFIFIYNNTSQQFIHLISHFLAVERERIRFRNRTFEQEIQKQLHHNKINSDGEWLWNPFEIFLDPGEGG